MAKDLKEQIEIMTHYLNGGEVECLEKGNDNWEIVTKPLWNFDDFEYRIKEPKQKVTRVTIEKWLCRDKHKDLIIIETSNIDNYTLYKKVKLMEIYEVEL